MTIFFSIYLFLLGLVLGSFYNVVGLRVPAKQSIVSPPSSCSHCGKRLTARNLIPVVSWLLARGKCTYCGTRLSAVYPLGELATGLLFVWVYITFGISWETLIGLLLVSLAVIVTVSDLKYMIIPNRILAVFSVPLILLRCYSPIESVWYHLLGAVLGGGILLLVSIVSRGGMGMGDVKLLALLGWVIGFPNLIPAFIAACFLGSLVGGVLLLLKLVQRKQPIPFGPFLVIGALLSFAYGSESIHFYLSIFE